MKRAIKPARNAAFQQALRTAVPDAMQVLRRSGRPTADARRAAHLLLQVFRSPLVDALFEQARADGHAALKDLIKQLIMTLAVLAHEPGGVQLWGLDFQVPVRVPATAPESEASL